jgi:hypothetical protein
MSADRQPDFLRQVLVYLGLSPCSAPHGIRTFYEQDYVKFLDKHEA